MLSDLIYVEPAVLTDLVFASNFLFVSLVYTLSIYILLNKRDLRHKKISSFAAGSLFALGSFIFNISNLYPFVFFLAATLLHIYRKNKKKSKKYISYSFVSLVVIIVFFYNFSITSLLSYPEIIANLHGLGSSFSQNGKDFFRLDYGHFQTFSVLGEGINNEILLKRAFLFYYTLINVALLLWWYVYLKLTDIHSGGASAPKIKKNKTVSKKVAPRLNIFLNIMLGVSAVLVLKALTADPEGASGSFFLRLIDFSSFNFGSVVFLLSEDGFTYLFRLFILFAFLFSIYFLIRGSFKWIEVKVFLILFGFLFPELFELFLFDHKFIFKANVFVADILDIHFLNSVLRETNSPLFLLIITGFISLLLIARSYILRLSKRNNFFAKTILLYAISLPFIFIFTHFSFVGGHKFFMDAHAKVLSVMIDRGMYKDFKTVPNVSKEAFEDALRGEYRKNQRDITKAVGPQAGQSPYENVSDFASWERFLLNTDNKGSYGGLDYGYFLKLRDDEVDEKFHTHLMYFYDESKASGYVVADKNYKKMRLNNVFLNLFVYYNLVFWISWYIIVLIHRRRGIDINT